MRAIDTNVLVRFLVADDKAQAAKARGAIEAGDIFVSSTVLLETEWVLRSGYGLASGPIVAALRGVSGLAGVTIESASTLGQVLDWTEAGMDFADAMHLAKADGCETFLSFDRKLAKAAKGRSPVTVMEP